MAQIKRGHLRAVLSLPEATIENPELYEIFQKTIWPYLTAFMANMEGDGRTENEKFQEALNLFFNVDHRTIDTYRAAETFRLPGRLKHAEETYWSPDESLQEIKKGEFLLVRIDTRVPWELEVQVVTNTYTDLDDRRQFILGPVEFYKMREKLVYVSSH